MDRPTDRRAETTRRWIAGGTIGLVAAAVIALLVLPGNDDDAIQPVDTPAPTTVEPTGSTVPSGDTTTPTIADVTTTVPDDSVPDVPSTTAPPSTTTSVSTTTSTNAPDPDPAVTQDAIDLTDASVFGLSYGAEADPDQVVADLEPALGSPTFDTGWQPTPTSFDPNYDACFGPRFRTIWWGDFRITVGEFEDGVVRVAAWTVGDPATDTSAPLGELPDARPPSGVAAEGVGIGATRADVLAVVPQDGRMIADTDDGVVVTGAVVTTFAVDGTDTVTGIGSGRLDCTAGAN